MTLYSFYGMISSSNIKSSMFIKCLLQIFEPERFAILITLAYKVTESVSTYKITNGLFEVVLFVAFNF